MLTPAERKNITFVYDKLLACETKGWAEVDEFMVYLEWLDNDQLYREADVLYSKHKDKKIGCPYESDHRPGYFCLVVFILEAVECILKLYKENTYLTESNRYILCNYLALQQAGQLVEIEK